MCLQVKSGKMVIEWKEREHNKEDELAMENERCMEALKDCGLKKFFLTLCLDNLLLHKRHV